MAKKNTSKKAGKIRPDNTDYFYKSLLEYAKLQPQKSEVAKVSRRKSIKKTLPSKSELQEKTTNKRLSQKSNKELSTGSKSLGKLSTKPTPGRSNRNTTTQTSGLLSQTFQDSEKKIKAARVSRKRGEKIVSYSFTSKKIEDKIKQFDKAPDKVLDFLQTKNRPLKGAGYKPPKGVIIIVKGEKGEGELAFKSPPGFVVNKRNVKAFTRGVLEKASQDIFKRSDSKNRKNLWKNKKSSKYDASGTPIDPTKINGVLIRYIY